MKKPRQPAGHPFDLYHLIQKENTNNANSANGRNQRFVPVSFGPNERPSRFTQQRRVYGLYFRQSRSNFTTLSESTSLDRPAKKLRLFALFAFSFQAGRYRRPAVHKKRARPLLPTRPDFNNAGRTGLLRRYDNAITLAE